MDVDKVQDDEQIGAGLARVDSILRAKFKVSPEKSSGSTVTGALVARQNDGSYSLKLVNCGDSRTLVVRGPDEQEADAKPVQLRTPDYLMELQSCEESVKNGFAAKNCQWPLVQETIDHKPNHPTESARIIAAGGHVSNDDPARVDGNLAVSRSLGDFDYKDENAPINKTKVSIEPDIYEVRGLQPGSIIILCCDGVWDVLSSEEVAALVRSEIAAKASADGKEQEADLGEIAASIVRLSFERSSKDNVTAMVVQLSPGGTWEKEKPMDEMKHFAPLLIPPNGEGAVKDECREHYKNFLLRYGFQDSPMPCERCRKWFKQMHVCPCQTAVYCSRTCQKRDFSKHKLVCSESKTSSRKK